MNLTIEVDGQVQLNRSIERFTEGLTDLRDLWPDIKREFWAIEEEQFASEGGSGAAGAWQPLSPAYDAWKSKNYPGANILYLTGRLRDSLTGDGGDTIIEEQPLSLRIGTAVDYAGFHQRGTSRMPARPPVSLSEDDKSRLMKVVQAYLVHRAREEFGAPGFNGGG